MRSKTDVYERLSALQAEAGADAVAEYGALSEDYWRTRKLINVLRVLSGIMIAIAAIVGLTYIFVGSTALAIAELVCTVWWVGLTLIAYEIELSTLRQWRLAMIKYVGWNLTADD